MYLAGAQLLFSAPRASLVAGLCGALAGAAYHSNFLGMKRLKVRVWGLGFREAAVFSVRRCGSRV